MGINIVFMGSAEFSTPVLTLLAQQYHIAGVVTQPDRHTGRGRKLTSPPIKELATSLEIPIIQPESIKQENALKEMISWKPDLIVVAAYGKILRDNILTLPRFGCLNVHASLLPRWRGASPVEAAIECGDEYTGVTIMIMDRGLDTGPILTSVKVRITTDETSSSLSNKLSTIGAKLLVDTIPLYINKEIIPIPQDEQEATYAPMINKSDGELNFSLPAVQLERKIRAYTPWPGTFTIWNNTILKIHQATVVSDIPNNVTPNPGERIIYEGKPAIITGEGLLVIERIQQAGRKQIQGTEFIRGINNW